MVRRILLKLLLIAAVLALLQLGFGAVSNYKDTPTPVRLCDRYLAEGRDIIFFGESTLYTVNPNDTDRSSIDRMLEPLIPQYRLGAIAHDAYHLQLYESFCAYIAQQSSHPRLLVVPINIGTLGPYWDARPEYQFQRIMLFLKNDHWWFRAFYRPLAAFGALDLNPVSQRAFDSIIVYDEDRPVGRMKDFMAGRFQTVTDENTRDQIVVRYMHNASPQDRKIQAMCRIAEISRRNGIPVLFYLTPIDYQAGDKSLGPRFTEHIARTIALIEKLLAERQCVPLNLALSLDSSYFHWGSRYPNEHLNERGRRFVAEQLAAAIGQRLGGTP